MCLDIFLSLIESLTPRIFSRGLRVFRPGILVVRGSAYTVDSYTSKGV